jgi:hypothetical protein
MTGIIGKNAGAMSSGETRSQPLVLRQGNIISQSERSDGSGPLFMTMSMSDQFARDRQMSVELRRIFQAMTAIPAWISTGVSSRSGLLMAIHADVAARKARSDRHASSVGCSTFSMRWNTRAVRMQTVLGATVSLRIPRSSNGSTLGLWTAGDFQSELRIAWIISC